MDGLRGVLAVYVMLGHALPLTNLPGWITTPFRHGEAAVDLFFALSGLVIAHSLERFGGQFTPFMAARARRLLPVYFLVLAVSIGLTALGDPLAALPWVGDEARHIMAAALPQPLFLHLAAHLTLTQGLIPQNALPYAYVTLLGPAWSLSTEWQFYVLIGLIAPRRLGRFALVLLALGGAYRTLPLGGEFSRAFLPDAAPFFALGLASAVMLRGGGTRVFWLCLAGACALALPGGIEKAVTPLAWGLAMLAQRQAWGAVLDGRAVQYLGAISYPLYLVNEPVQRALAPLLGPLAQGHAARFTTAFLPLSLGLSLALAALLHHAIERPFMRRQNDRLPRETIAAAVAE
ncbi:peptidoglycan/LPS O-acetylase OafA/YrhL [Acidocella aromatica]|uniref:Peptidoglycan/LPS O-acetylase OafA/YrhL n=2 Tax=Acidocella aromatica TaxID=1303579 RepID=A0A840VQA1_9PROT|nr:peptidoglycan/LPS O-acetylase OafA/YrhL [Acidocella aromatica]